MRGSFDMRHCKLAKWTRKEEHPCDEMATGVTEHRDCGGQPPR
jgi:hypothetical protein